MPREHRKRGKRKKNEKEADINPIVTSNLEPEELGSGHPSWIETEASSEAAFNPEAPFGFCDPDVKAYFRTVDKQLAEWLESGIENETDIVEDPSLGESPLSNGFPGI
jgi:nucleolar protein 9